MPLCTAAIQPGAIGASLGIEPFTPSALSTPSLAGPGPTGSFLPAGASLPVGSFLPVGGALSAGGQDPAALPAATNLTAASGFAANEIGVPAGNGLPSPGVSATAPPSIAPSLLSPPPVPTLPGPPPAPGAGPAAAPSPSSPAAPPPPALTAPAGPDPDGAGPLATLIGD